MTPFSRYVHRPDLRRVPATGPRLRAEDWRTTVARAPLAAAIHYRHAWRIARHPELRAWMAHFARSARAAAHQQAALRHRLAPVS